MLTAFDYKTRYPTHFFWQNVQGCSLFSSSAGFDPENLYFGELYSFCDYRCQPGYGIPKHPHEFFEVICIMLSGNMHFADNLGNDVVNSVGAVHVFSSAGGYLHSSHAVGQEQMRFVSMWLRPAEPLDQPVYRRSESAGKDIEIGEIRKILYHSEKRGENSLYVNADAEVFMGRVDKEVTEFQCSPVGIGLLYVTDGTLFVNDVRLEQGEHVRFENEPILTLQGDPEGKFISVLMPHN